MHLVRRKQKSKPYTLQNYKFKKMKLYTTCSAKQLNENYKQAYQHIVLYSTTSKCGIEAPPTLIRYLIINTLVYRLGMITTISY